MPRYVPQYAGPSRAEAGCPACHRRHPEHLAHIGTPSDWSPEGTARVAYREWAGALEAFAHALGQHRNDAVTWTHHVARLLERRDPDLQVAWLTPGYFDVEADHVIYVLPPDTRLRVSCGILELFAPTPMGCEQRRLVGPDATASSLVPLVLISCTGICAAAEAVRKQEVAA